MSHRLVVGLILVTLGCGDNKGAAVAVDAAPADAPPVDTLLPLDANPSDLIAAARMAADGGGLMLPISYAVVTYLKPQIGSTTNDPAGFTIQAQKMGPALFVAGDPALTTPPLARGDIVSFTITDLATVGGQKRAIGISNLVRHSQGFDVTTLSQELSAATDLVTAMDDYDSELVDITGTIGPFGGSGAGFERAVLTTAGISGNANFVVRVPSTLRDAIDMVDTCTVTLKDTPFGRFIVGNPPTPQTQLAAFTASDLTLTGCPAPTVVSATELSATSVRLTFSRNVLPGSVMADGSQFTFDNGLVASAATVSGRTVTITTDAQAVGTTYTVTVANTVTDLQGSGVAASNTATFAGFVTPAIVRINELNPHIGNSTNQCDLLELRVISGGSMIGIQIKERNVIVHTFANLTVAKNDIIVLHFASGSTTCNPGTSVSETTINGQPAATFTQNYDSAFDIYTTDTGLTDTDNVIAVLDKVGAYVDTVFIDNGDDTTANDTESAAATAVTANQWQMVGGGTPVGGFADATFTPHAVVDSDATGTTATGDTLRRIDDTDDNDKADWLQGTNTWGLINAGQTPIP